MLEANRESQEDDLIRGMKGGAVMDEVSESFLAEEKEAESLSADSIDKDRLRLLAGSKADYYLAQWDEILRRQSNHCGFNKAAFFLAGLWVAYRKMYGVAFALWLVVSLETVISDVVFVEILGHDDSPTWYDRLTTLLVALVCGYFGNRWYYWHCRRKLNKAFERELSVGNGLEKALHSAGGTSILSSILVTLLGFGMFFGIWMIYATIIDAINGV